jgi:hypothetical protein
VGGVGCRGWGVGRRRLGEVGGETEWTAARKKNEPLFLGKNIVEDL